MVAVPMVTRLLDCMGMRIVMSNVYCSMVAVTMVTRLLYCMGMA